MKFINLDSDDDNLEIKPRAVPKKIILDRELEIPVIGQRPKEDSEDFEEEAAGVCGIEQYYGDPDEKGYFLTENLFSELVSNYQRAKARFNLGIGEEYVLKWGNITGEISSQIDLTKYLTQEIVRYSEEHNLEINETLALFVLEINNLLEQKVGIDSPSFIGTPTTTHPNTGDDSNRIPTTAWVNSKLGNQSSFLKYIKFNKDYIFSGEVEENVTLEWEFYTPVDKILVDGLEISKESTEYLYTNINEAFFTTFIYETNGKEYKEVILFNVIDPIYIGISPDIDSMELVKDSELIVNLGPKEFVYLYIPGNKKARFSVDNLYGGFIKLESKDLSGNIVNNMINVHGRIYYLYQSVNSGLGEIHIKYE